MCFILFYTSNCLKSNNMPLISSYNMIHEMVELLYLESINYSSVKNKNNVLSAVRDLNNDSKIFDYINDLEDFTDLEIIFNLAEENLIASVEPAYSDELKALFHEKKLELYITLLLLFNDFNLNAILPGNLLSHNSNYIDSDTLKWNFDLSDFIDKDYTIEAKSRVIYKSRIIIFIIGLLAIAAMIIKKYKK